MTYFVIAPDYIAFRQWVKEQGIPENVCRYVSRTEDLEGIRPGPSVRLIKLEKWSWHKDADFLNKVHQLETLPSTVKAQCGPGTAIPFQRLGSLKPGFIQRGFTEPEKRIHVQVRDQNPKAKTKINVPPGSYTLELQHKGEQVLVLERRDNGMVIVLTSSAFESMLSQEMADISLNP